MKQYEALSLPVGVSLTHDKGNPVVFAYVGGNGRMRMKAKRFNPRIVGSIEEAIELAIEWRAAAHKEHVEAIAALPPRWTKKTALRARSRG